MLTMPARGRVREWLDSALAFLFVALLLASWTTHIVVCVAQGLWGLLVVGLLLFPVAVLHGLEVLVTTWL